MKLQYKIRGLPCSLYRIKRMQRRCFLLKKGTSFGRNACLVCPQNYWFHERSFKGFSIVFLFSDWPKSTRTFEHFSRHECCTVTETTYAWQITQQVMAQKMLRKPSSKWLRSSTFVEPIRKYTNSAVEKKLCNKYLKL